MALKNTPVQSTFDYLGIIGVSKNTKDSPKTILSIEYDDTSDYLRTGTQCTISLCTSITALSDSRNVEGSLSAEEVSVVGESGIAISLSELVDEVEAQSGRLVMMMLFVAIIMNFVC